MVKVAAALTSQRCSARGHVDPKSRESQAVFPVHPLLTYRAHADVHAAQNVLAAGRARGLNADGQTACGGEP
ncbi:transposase [Mycobacterium simiae]|uniref:Transposase n=1 Tax=Mycobacterium simiae TaxID=1784 RepID=A0A5B1BIX7_MYCSI|nr:zinc ribbon domain-containing protein [Mycobacterium simiae]KAA1248316.1 transposase [Mycobacterium simiae]